MDNSYRLQQQLLLLELYQQPASHLSWHLFLLQEPLNSMQPMHPQQLFFS
jgi:hypothetical protein